jgi:Cu+-exporting ATPase
MATKQDTAIDPVCGMTVDSGGARRSEHDGNVYFFCSAGCQAKFDDDPAGGRGPSNQDDGYAVVGC